MIGNSRIADSRIASSSRTPAIVITPSVMVMTLKPPGPVIEPDVIDMELDLLAPNFWVPQDITKSRGRLTVSPVFIVDIVLGNSGETLRLSDRNLNYLGTEYQSYISVISGLGDATSSFDSRAINSSVEIVFRNEAYKTFDYLINIGNNTPFEGADVTISEVYVLPDGNISMAEIVFRGALEEPREIDRIGFVCSASSIEYHRARLTSPATVTLEDYPNAFEDLGEPIPCVIGEDVLLPTKRIDWGAKTTLVTALTTTSVSAILSVATRFPSSGSFWVDNELITYSGKSGNTLTGLTRGTGGTSATVHSANATVWENQANYDSVISDHPLKDVKTVYAEINGELYRVTAGVSDLVSGGRHILRASSQIKVDSQEEDISVQNPQHSHPVTQNKAQFSLNFPDIEDGCGLTGNGSENLLFPSTTGKTGANYEIGFVIDFTGPGCVNTPDDATVSIDGIIVYKSVGGVTTIQLSSPLKFSQATPSDSLPVVFTFFHPVGSAGLGIEITSANRSVEVVGTVVPEAQASARIGDLVETYSVDRFHAKVDGAEDTTGIYAGVATVIKRPDHVLRWLLTEKMGFMSTDINLPTFDAAGALYAAQIVGGCELAFKEDLVLDINQVLSEIASESRSILTFVKGQWELNFLPDAAPSPVKVISESEIEGQGRQFKFSKESILSIFNSIRTLYDKNYSPLRGDSQWNSTYFTSDATSITKYGEYTLDLPLSRIKDQGTAEDLADFKLSQLKDPGVVVSFPLFFEHFDLVQGDTVELDSVLFDGENWLIEEWVRGPDAGGKITVNIVARKWWN